MVGNEVVLRDKTYIRLDNGMLFNVTGYEHAPGRVFGSLKYVRGKKWTAGYDVASRFLSTAEPELIDENGYISIPAGRIASVYDPQVRWTELQRNTQAISALQCEALELGNALRQILRIPKSDDGLRDSEFGITDSLLWGEGGPHSDIDLVVVGRENADRVFAHAPSIYAHDGFQRPDPMQMAAPYGLRVPNWPQILSRKLHMGSFRNRLFSLRAVLRECEIEPPKNWQAAVRPRVELDFRVCDRRDSLFFPAVYRNETGDELVDYSVAYEGVFCVGDTVRCECEHLQNWEGKSPPRNRFVLHRVVRFASSHS